MIGLINFVFYIPYHGCQSLVCFTRSEPGHHAHVDDHLYLTLILATNNCNKRQCTLRNEISLEHCDQWILHSLVPQQLNYSICLFNMHFFLFPFGTAHFLGEFFYIRRWVGTRFSSVIYRNAPKYPSSTESIEWIIDDQAFSPFHMFWHLHHLLPPPPSPVSSSTG